MIWRGECRQPVKPAALCEPSQKGLFDDAPQRHSATFALTLSSRSVFQVSGSPCSDMTGVFDVTGTPPLTRYGPPAATVIFWSVHDNGMTTTRLTQEHRIIDPLYRRLHEKLRYQTKARRLPQLPH